MRHTTHKVQEEEIDEEEDQKGDAEDMIFSTTVSLEFTTQPHCPGCRPQELLSIIDRIKNFSI